MDLNKVTLCWPNRVDQCTLTGGSWSASLPESNLQSRILAKKARTAGLLSGNRTATNLALQSQSFGVNWGKANLNTPIAGSANDPGGSATAAKLVPNATSGLHYMHQSSSLVAGGQYTFSIYLKAIEYGFASISLPYTGFGSSHRIDVNLGTGAVSVGSGTPDSYGVTPAPNGYYRVWVTGIASVTGSVPAMFVLVSNASGMPEFSGDNTSGIAAWGAQFEAAPEPGVYTPTTSAPAVTTNPSTISAALDSDRPTFAIALAAHNLSAVAKWRVRLFSDYGQVVKLWDSGVVDVWPASYAIEQVEWEDNSFWLGGSGMDVAADFTPLAYIFADNIYSARAVQIDILDPTNPATYVEIGRLFISGAWQPEFNMQYGVAYGYVTNTDVDEALDGTEYFKRRKSRRTMNFEIRNMQPTDAFSQIYAMQRDQGIDREILVAANLLTEVESYYNTFLGRNAEVTPLTNPYFKRYDVNLNIREIL